MKTHTRFVAFFMTLVLLLSLLPGSASAVLLEEIIELEASYAAGIVSVRGQTHSEASALAVAIILYEGDTLLQLYTTGVEDHTFEAQIPIELATGTYTIKAANYEGGPFAEVTFESSAASSSRSTGNSGTPSILVETTQQADRTDNTLTVSGSIESGTMTATLTSAMIEALFNKASSSEGLDKEDRLVIKIQGGQNNLPLEVSLPQEALAQLAASSQAGLRLDAPWLSITFDSTALNTIAQASSGDEILFSAARVDEHLLSQEDLKKIAGRPVYEFSLSNSGIPISHFGGGSATISLPYTLQPGEDPNSIVIYHLGSEGLLTPLRGYYDKASGRVLFKTTHFSSFVVGYQPVVFEDVPATAWYHPAVTFIAARGITSGTGPGQYSPDAKLTRAQFLVLLMNAYQLKPLQGVVSLAEDNFNDAGNDYYTDYLHLAKNMGIVGGVGNNQFAPTRELTRQEMLVMLHNVLVTLDEVPGPRLDLDLEDYQDGSGFAFWAREGVTALVQGGIVGGYNQHLYPHSPSTRAEIAQLLHNLLVR